MPIVKRGEELKQVRKFLETRDWWPEEIDEGETYSIQADDQDGDRTTGWLSVITFADVCVCFGEHHANAVFRHRFGGGTHLRVRMALLALAEAIRLDNIWADSYEPIKHPKGRSYNTRRLHELLENMPWLPSLNGSDQYMVHSENEQSDSPEGWLSVMFTPHNDTRIIIDADLGRFRSDCGGGHKLRVLAALYILAEAIRLDTEGESR